MCQNKDKKKREIFNSNKKLNEALNKIFSVIQNQT